MKRIILFIIASLEVSVAFISFAGRIDNWEYEKLWMEVKEASRNDLPATSQAIVRKIYDAATEQGDAYQRLRAADRMLELKRKIDWKSVAPYLDSLRQSESTYSGEGLAVYRLMMAKWLAGNIRYGENSAVRYTELPLEKWDRKCYVDAIKDYILPELDPATIVDKKADPYVTLLPIPDAAECPPRMLEEFILRGRLDIMLKLNPDERDRSFINAMFARLLEINRENPPYKVVTLTRQAIARYLNNEEFIPALDTIIKTFPDEPNVLLPVSEKFSRMLQVMVRNHKGDSTAIANILPTCDNLLDRFDNSLYRSNIANIIDRLTAPKARLNHPSQFYPGKEGFIMLYHTNMPAVDMELYLLDHKDTMVRRIIDGSNTYLLNNYAPSLKERGELVLRKEGIKLNNPLYREVETRIPLKLENEGLYLMLMSNVQNVYRSDERTILNASALLYAGQIGVIGRQRGTGYEIYAADFETGKPIERVGLTMCNILTDTKSKERDKIEDRYQNFALDGFTPLPVSGEGSRSRNYFKISREGEDFYPFVPYYTQNHNPQSFARRCELYTDRGRYLPGDTVRFKGVFYDVDAWGASVVKDAGGKITFTSPNNTVLTTFHVTSNEWGSFDGHFVIPAGNINGIYHLSTSAPYAATCFINVESYKRPTIAIAINEPGRGYRFGDTVRLEGKVNSYAGFGVSNAKVGYKVTLRNNNWFWDSWMYHFDQEIVASSEEISGKDGCFSIRFYAGKPKPQYYYGNYYNRTSAVFEIEFTATDEKGESQQTRQQLFISDVAYIISSNINPAINREQPDSLLIEVRDAYGKVEKVACGYTISSGNKIVRKSAITGGKAAKLDVAGLPQGRYLLEYFTADTTLSRRQSAEFILFSAKENGVPVDTVGFFAPLQLKGHAKQPAEFLFGTSCREIYARMELFYGDSLMATKPMLFRQGMQRIQVPYPDSYPDNASLRLTYVHGGKFFTENAELERKRVKPSITMRLVSLRTPSRPGTQENFSIEVKDNLGKPAKAEVVVAVYDKSVDGNAVRSFNPLNTIPWKRTTPYHRDAVGFGAGSRNFYRKQERNTREEMTDAEDIVVIGYGTAKRSDLTGSVAGITMASINNNTDDYFISSGESLKIRVSGTSSLPDEVRAKANLRRDLRHTAAFLPHVATDAKGMADISFMLPDNLTTYRILAMAHTQEALSAVCSAEMVVRKELMVMPHLPQFVREGDRLTLRTTVMNLTDRAVAGEARIELFDPIDSALLMLPGLESRPLRIEAEGKEVVTWSIEPPAGKRVLGIRIMAATPTHTDGQEETIPVMPSREEFIRSQTFVMRDTGRLELDLMPLLGDRNLDKESLHINVSSPERLILSALPSAAKPTSDCLVDWVSAWYINFCGKRMLYENPTYASIVRNWAKDTALMKDPLESGSKAVGMLLSETPWARVPGINRQRAAALNNMLNTKFTSELMRNFIVKVRTMQNPDGGFGWFPGMSSSPLLTSYFMDRAGELITMKAITFNNIKYTSERTAKYLDEHFLNIYRREMEMTEDSRPDRLSFDLLLYLSSRTPFLKDIPLSDEGQEAWDYYIAKVERTWTNNSLMERLYICKALDAGERYVRIPAILRSISEYVVQNETMGVYFPNLVMPFKGLMCSEIKAHAMALELFSSRAEYASLAEGIAQWLMLQRRNQMWENCVATADVVRILWKYYGNRGIDRDTRYAINLPRSARGNSSNPFDGFDAKPAIVREKGKVAISKSGETPLFVDIIYRFEDELSQVKPYSEGLSVERTFFRISYDGGKEVYEPITEETILHIGERVMARYSIDSDENRSFVLLKALRPGGLQPESTASGYMPFGFWGAYRDVRESYTHYFFNLLPETHSWVEERFFVTYEGRFFEGAAKIVSLYAPQYAGNSAAGVMRITE